MTAATLLAIDFGTTRIKIGLLRRDGDFRLLHAAPALTVHPEPGAAIQEPEYVLAACIEGLRRSAAEAPSPEGLVLTGQMGGLIVVDARGEARTPWITGMDTRCRETGEALRREAGERIRRLSSCAPEMAERVRWAREIDVAYEEGALALLLPAYIATRLAEDGITAAYYDRPSTCWSGFADMVEGRWDGELCRAAGWRAEGLPPIVEPGAAIGTLSAAAARATGLPAGLPLIAGPGDQAANLYGLGCTSLGVVVDIAATFPIMVGVTDRYAILRSERLDLMPSAVPGIWHPLCYLLGSGSVFSWFAGRIAGVSLNDLEREAAALGPSGVVAIPYGAPVEGTGGSGIWWGLEASHARGHLYRALLEGVACEYVLMAEELRAEGVRLDPPVTALGGGSGSSLLTQIKATMLGLPWRCLPGAEATVAGAALVAAHRNGWDTQLVLPEGEVVVPDERAVAPYRAHLERYRAVRRLAQEGAAHS
jgi:xylulokinase